MSKDGNFARGSIYKKKEFFGVNCNLVPMEKNQVFAYRVPIGCVVLDMFRNLLALLSRFALKNAQYQIEAVLLIGNCDRTKTSGIGNSHRQKTCQIAVLRRLA